MKKILLTAFLIPLSLFARIDESRFIQYLHDEIDGNGYKISYSDDEDSFFSAWHIGYYTAISHLLNKIKQGSFDSVRD